MTVQKPKRPRKHLENVADLLLACIDYTISDVLVLSRLERVISPKPASLAATEEEERHVNDRIEKLCQKLAAPPDFIIYLKENGPPKYDTFGQTALHEILSAFDRSRRAVCRTHIRSLASLTYTQCPQVLKRVPPDSIREGISNLIEEPFWEHAEIAYIRLAAFWDRVGQLLNFIFFNIRQTERDGFLAVADRLRVNYVPMFSELNTSDSWKAIRDYTDSEKKNGLKWLLRRRNLLVHSLHLRSIKGDTHDYLQFSPEYDHLLEKRRTRLEPGSESDEIQQMHAHLSAAARLFEHVLGVCEIGVLLRTRFLLDDRTRDRGRKQ